jgi:hypothetical protein
MAHLICLFCLPLIPSTTPPAKETLGSPTQFPKPQFILEPQLQLQTPIILNALSHCPESTSTPPKCESKADTLSAHRAKVLPGMLLMHPDLLSQKETSAKLSQLHQVRPKNVSTDLASRCPTLQRSCPLPWHLQEGVSSYGQLYALKSIPEAALARGDVNCSYLPVLSNCVCDVGRHSLLVC